MNEKNDDEGFLTLLKPIQDLTRNWDVDLSLHLEEYINYIRQICGDKIPDMNFAQAAVLLQNSANIYSKKVDFLFTTVMQLLDTLSKKHRLIQGGKPLPDSPHRNRRNEAKRRDGGEVIVNDGEGRAKVRRKATTVLDTEQFVPLDTICSERCLSLDFEKEKLKVAERKKQKIVLNAAIKVKAKEKTSSVIYNYKQDAMGKKEEFRLNWRICSAGTLHEEFVISKNQFKNMEPVEMTVSSHNYSNGNYDYDAPHEPNSPVVGDTEERELHSSPLPVSPPHDTSVKPSDIESEANPLKNVIANRNIQNVIDIDGIEWQATPKEILENPTKKRKVFKPADLDDKKRKHRNGCHTKFTIADVLLFSYKSFKYDRDTYLFYESKEAIRLKKQLVLQHRAKYRAYSEEEAGKEQLDDFQGFYNEDKDSDNENDFEGFENENEPGECELGIADNDPPLENGHDLVEEDSVWQGDGTSTYQNEAMKTLKAFRSRKIDHDRMTDMARRVEEWHQKILPKLESAEQRSGFDVHEYGTKILDNFNGKIGTEKLLVEIVGGKPREEVARYFLSTLMLANQYNLEISETEDGYLQTDCVKLKLLSTVRHHEELDDNLKHTAEK